ncbi:hypothetical protein [Desulfofalx alkaliphila]|uniref:hypothetical protein n=1 Tax=Desulfofalx alkaliphila TaxID=105483 RepID=UPI0004E1CFA9|nr:hypothetical protein [Desulfofalx alkaliphila]
MANKNLNNFAEFAKEIGQREEGTIIQPELGKVLKSDYVNGFDEALDLMEKAERSFYRKGKYKWKKR